MGKDYQAVAQKSMKIAGAAVKDVLAKNESEESVVEA